MAEPCFAWTLAIEVLVERSRIHHVLVHRGDDEARIGLAFGPLGLRHHAALACPAVVRLIDEILEAARGTTRRLVLRLGLGQLGQNRRVEPDVFGAADDEVHVVVLAPRHQFVAAEACICAHVMPEACFATTMSASGQCARMKATIRAISSVMPKAPSTLDGLSRAVSR